MKTSKMALTGMAFSAMLLAAFAHAEAPKVQSTPYTWTTAPMGGGGFVDGFVYHPAEKGLMYARTDVGGAYRWDAADRSWVALLDGRTNGDDNGVLSIALDARDPNKVYLATGLNTGDWAGAGHILRSSDRGTTWESTELPVKLGGNENGRGTGERLAVDPNSGNILFLGSSNDGLLKSTDGAKTWSSVSAFPEKHVNFVLFDPRSGSQGTASKTIYVGTNSKDHNLFVSRDGGSTWEQMTGTPGGFVAHHADFDASGNALYVTFADHPGPNDCHDGAVSKLDLASGQWKDISPQKPGNGGPAFCYAAVSAAGKPGTLIVSTLDRWWGGDTIFRSTDGGLHWTDLKPLSKHESPDFPWIFGGAQAKDSMGAWTSDAKINPFDPNEAIYGTGSGLWMTENLTDADAGKPITWTFEVANVEETAVLDMVSPPAGAHLIVSVGDVGGFRFLDFNGSPPLEGGYYQPVGGSNRTVDFAELNPGFVVRTADGDSKSHAFYSIDNGKTWADMPSSPPLVLHDDKGWYAPGRIAVSANGTSMVWVTGKGDAYYSKDRGKTWTPSAGYPKMNGRFLLPISDRTADGVFYTYNRSTGEMLLSADGGATFKVFTKGLPVLDGWAGDVLPRAVPGHVRDLWLPTRQGLLHSSDMKSGFSPVADTSDVKSVGFGKAADGKTYPTLFMWGRYKGVFGIFRSTDEGKSWVRINDDAHQYGNGGGEVIGDPRVFGLVYVAARGVVIGLPATAGTDK